jgi:hypothetical protein
VGDVKLRIGAVQLLKLMVLVLESLPHKFVAEIEKELSPGINVTFAEITPLFKVAP